MKTAGTTKCKVATEGRTDPFFFYGVRYDVFVKDIREGGLMQLRVNDADLTDVEINATESLGNLSLWITHIEQFGGNCKEEVD